MAQSWEAAVVACLASWKRQGVKFDDAWSMALRTYPPRRRDREAVTFDDIGQAFLFDESGLPSEESVVAFMRRVTMDAWYGERPTLRHFSLDMLRDDPGDSRLNDGLGKLAA